MAYGIFNLDSGNLIDSFKSEKRAFTALAELLEEVDPDAIGLVFSSRGRQSETLTGDDLRRAVERYAEPVASRVQLTCLDTLWTAEQVIRASFEAVGLRRLTLEGGTGWGFTVTLVSDLPVVAR